MNWLLIALVLILVVALAFADYKWRQWMAARRRDRNTPPSP
jgi:Tfp pilus assembly protein PilV